MADVQHGCAGPLAALSVPLESWLVESRFEPGRARRVVRAFGRLSSWLGARGVSLAGLDEDMIDEHIRAEQMRSGKRFPAALQHLPLAKRFLAVHGVLILRGPARRDRGGIPRLPAGPLAEVVVDLVAWLHAEGYARGTVMSVAGTAARLGAWMGETQVRLEDLNDAVLDRFVAAQESGLVRHPSSAQRIVTVRTFLNAAGLLSISPIAAPAAVTPVDEVLQVWGQYERDEHGLSARWVREQHRWARAFLEQMTGPDGLVRWDSIDVRTVNSYVAVCGQGYSVSSRKHLVAAMRSLLRWAFGVGRLERQMGAGVLGPPRRALVGLPQAITPGQVEAIKAAADTGTAIGIRNYAVVVMISRLGLRAGEVAGLQLDDIDWRNGQVSVRGKGRVLTLPLPADVGDALVTYLREARPDRALERSVFVRDRPPLRGLSGKGISGIVAALARHAGLGVMHAHRLRHTAATDVLTGGGSLVEARELLGHARMDTTMIYARTDLRALGELVTAWGTVPGA